MLVDGHAARRRIVSKAVPSGAVVAGREDAGSAIRVIEEHGGIRDAQNAGSRFEPKSLPEETLFSTARLTVGAAERKPEPAQRAASTLRSVRAVLLTQSTP